MYCKKLLRISSAISSIKKVIYANKICLAIAKEQKLYIFSLEMELLKEIKVYAIIHQIIPSNNKFICFSNSYTLEVSERDIKRNLMGNKINYDQVKYTVDTKNYCMFVYTNSMAILIHKTEHTHLIEGEINDFYGMNIIDIHFEGDHLYLLHKSQDRQLRPCGNEIIYTNILSYYKYHNKQITFIDSIDVKQCYKVIGYNRIVTLFDQSSIYKIVMDELFSQHSKSKDTDGGAKQKNKKNQKMRYEYVCKNMENTPKCFALYQNGILIACENTEILYFDGNNLTSKGFLMQEIVQMIFLYCNKLLCITKEGGSMFLKLIL